MGELTDPVEKYDNYCRQKIVEELEKIKEECEDLIQFHGKRTDDYGIGKKEAYKHIIEFVNERIVKLKGECE